MRGDLGIRQRIVLHFAGGATSKLAPPATQFLLLLLVARESGVASVGKLALASAASFACGAIAEIGFATTLSVPRAYFGTAAPPLRGTRRLRLAAAASGAALYLVLWACGLGGYDARFLIVAPLPVALALGSGYSGVLNAAGALQWEGAIAAAEACAVLVVAVAAAGATSALAAALAGLVAGRCLGTLARARIVRRLPRSEDRPPAPHRAQAPFAISTLLIVVQGQVELLALGFVGSFALAGVYGPLLRTAGGLLLLAEAVSWGLYGGVGGTVERQQRLVRYWRSFGPLVGLVLGALFLVGAHPFLELLLGTSVRGAGWAIALLALVIVTRFGSFTLTVPLVRAGRQREQVPVVAAAAVVLSVAGVLAAAAGSLTGLAAARLASEVVIAAGYLALNRRPPAATRETIRPVSPLPGREP